MRTVVPFDGRDPNTRLSPVLAPEERRDFARATLRDVLAAVRDAGGDPVVLATTPVDVDIDVGVDVVVDDRPLDDAVTAALDAPTAVVMSDLALATPAALRRAFDAAPAGGVAAAPGLGGGTNVLVVRAAGFATDYHGTSFRDHETAAAAVDAPFERVDSFRLAVDVDAPGDLAEVLLHGDGAAADWLRDAGFRIDVRDGRAAAVRDGND